MSSGTFTRLRLLTCSRSLGISRNASLIFHLNSSRDDRPASRCCFQANSCQISLIWGQKKFQLSKKWQMKKNSTRREANGVGRRVIKTYSGIERKVFDLVIKVALLDIMREGRFCLFAYVAFYRHVKRESFLCLRNGV